MNKLAYYHEKENTFHEREYVDDDVCKHDYRRLKKAKVPFFHATWCPYYGFEMENHGLGCGKLITFKDLPEKVYQLMKNELDKDENIRTGGKREFVYDVYESSGWYTLYVDCGEDAFENEYVIYMFVTKDGNSVLYAS